MLRNSARGWPFALAALVALAGLVSCGPGRRSKFPERPEGCDVTLYRSVPTVASDNIGPVTATCETSVPNDACVRTLKDEVCRLGGDVVWGVDATPETLADGEKKRFSGRAAHTHAAAKATEP